MSSITPEVSQRQQQSYPVQLALYDLSHGMARGLSAQFLGGPEHAIDLIPHTGVLVYGKEYFFGGGSGGNGGGVSVEDPHVFRTTRNMAPIQILTLEATTVTQGEFEQWCLQQSGTYSGVAYDLFRNNCNHFSHDATMQGLQLSTGVPQYILDIPNQFLNSPMGQMISPMLQGMQVGGGTPFTPSGQGIPGATTSTSTASNNNQAPPAHNPWATTVDNNNSSSNSRSTVDTTAARKASATKPSTPFLDTNNRPLLSNDTKTAIICANKFQHVSIQRVAAMIAASGSSNHDDVPFDLLNQACDALLKELRQGGGSVQVTFGIMLLRLFVLRMPPSSTNTNNNDANSMKECMEWIKTQLVASNTTTTTSDNDHHPLSDPARSMAWCCMSNHVATTTIRTTENLDGNLTSLLVDAAFQDVNSSKRRPEVKQAAASYLYNLVICLSAITSTPATTTGEQEQENDLSDVMVSLLCGALDSIHEETDSVTLERRLLVVGRLLLMHDNKAAQLVMDLGFDDLLQSMKTSGNTKVLVDEILLLLLHVRSS